ncbi:DUF2071 domain-containing protein [Actinoplanes sp. DH11]|uniref:DUF2071 domain-containing protein n=1 Tax=Actinoplanes sp. DH11 TaxID=2857011 RepID=UPI001E491643|nr:DUF2071 domain-containing protein [Actinoplanes sp. DH11]
MGSPRLASVVERRLLVNYRTDPEITARLVPAPLRPQVVDGWAVSGICLIRLRGVRPARPGARGGAAAGWVGPSSENAAHRIAVEWDTPDGVATGVYIPRRDTGSRLNAWAGGRLFPGWHHRSDFRVRDDADGLRVAVGDPDDGVRVDVHARTATTLSGSHLFPGIDQASAFFRHGATGFSTTPDPARLDGVRLHTGHWQVTPMTLVSVRSTFFDDPVRFPPGSAVPDCALLMRDVPATWIPLPPMPVRPVPATTR